MNEGDLFNPVVAAKFADLNIYGVGIGPADWVRLLGW